MTNREIVTKVLDRWENSRIGYEWSRLIDELEKSLNQAEQRGRDLQNEEDAKFLETDGWNDSWQTVNQKKQAFAYASVIRALRKGKA